MRATHTILICDLLFQWQDIFWLMKCIDFDNSHTHLFKTHIEHKIALFSF